MKKVYRNEVNEALSEMITFFCVCDSILFESIFIFYFSFRIFTSMLFMANGFDNNLLTFAFIL